VIKKISQQQLRNLIREELARGIPDWAFSDISEDLIKKIKSPSRVVGAVIEASEALLKILVSHANRTSTDKTVMKRRHQAANDVSRGLRDDRKFMEKIKQFVGEDLSDEERKEFKILVEERLKEALLIYLQTAV
jgi:hypothetical protein